MNRLFGALTQQHIATSTAALAAWAVAHNANARFSDNGAHVRIDDGGSVVGHASNGSLHLSYLGWINTITDTNIKPLDCPNSSAALLLSRFEQCEHQFLNGVEGSYIVVLHNSDNTRVLVASGPSGDRRLFISQRNGGLYYASHLSDYQFLFGDTLALNRNTEAFLLAYEFLPDTKTPYRDVYVLDSGTVLDWHQGAIKEYPIRSGPQLELSQTQLRFEHITDTLEQLLLDTLAQQIPSSGKIAVLLGGFDSALIAAMLKRMGRDIETFTFQYPDQHYNQAYVEELASHLGITHHWVPLNADTVLEGLKHYATYFNQPVSQAHYPITSLAACNAMRAKGFTYCLTGDGCDGIFLGYPTVHQRARLIRMLSNIAWLLAPMRAIARIAPLERALGHPYRLARNVLRMLGRTLPARAYISACALDDFSYAQLQTSPPPAQTIDAEATLAQLAEQGRGQSIVRMAYMGKAHVGLNRTKLEGCSAAAGIVLNSPFLHPNMKQLAQLLPDQFMRPDHEDPSNATGKYALMRMAEHKAYLPHAIIHQPKMSPVTAPVDTWYMNELQAPLRALLAGLPCATSDAYIDSLFTDKWAERVFRTHMGISRYTSNVLSMLLSYASFNNDRRQH